MDVRRENREQDRLRMVRHQIEARGVQDEHVLEAMRQVPREAFVEPSLAEFAYFDSPLPIARGQTVSQPYVVAFMAEAAAIEPGDRVLEIGTGSGYAAAVFARLAAEVFTVERHPELAEQARRALAAVGAENVHVRAGDGSAGWEEAAPFEAIIVSAGAPRLPESLKRQLAVGGCLIVPVARDGGQRLLCVTHHEDGSFAEEDLGDVQFVPLVGEAGWRSEDEEARDFSGNRLASPRRKAAEGPRVLSEDALVGALREAAEPLPAIATEDFRRAFDRLGDATVVGLGEATHGTSEFYRARAAITRQLIEHHGVTIVAVEADWPDAALIDRYVRHRPPVAWAESPFTRFPAWMWRNAEMRDFIEWLRDYNAGQPPERRVSFHGLDLYALHTSIRAVVGYLEKVDPGAAAVACERYACLTPWQRDPASYGRAALTKGVETCEAAVVDILRDLLRERARYAAEDSDDYLDAEGNARLVQAAEAYYRAMYYNDVQSWNLRDRHMFETLERVRAARPGPAKAVVWAHNSHIGDANGTEMGLVREELNIGQLCRERYGSDAALVGFGTDRGEVAAASDWNAPMEVKAVRPALAGSIEALCRQTRIESFLFDLGRHAGSSLVHTLLAPRFERAIGVIYRPENEFASHYFEASLPRQFDHYVWFERTGAVTPLSPEDTRQDLPETYPFTV